VTTADARFLGLELREGAPAATLLIERRHCTPFGWLYGGSGVAACAAVAEAVTGRPLVWITTQYIGNAHPGERLDFDVEVMVAARATSQALVRAHVGDRLVLHATTALTDRDPGEVAWWGSMPEVAPPEECQRFRPPFEVPLEGSFLEVLERRVAPDWQQAAQSGRLAMWSRVPGWGIGSPASQAFAADIVPLVVAAGLGRPPGGTSLDNTVRIVHGEPVDDWVLLDIEAQGFRRGIGHGQVRLWSRDGTLLGVASQTCIIRTSHQQPAAPAE
jgi:acyl-CoA thioesterase II